MLAKAEGAKKKYQSLYMIGRLVSMAVIDLRGVFREYESISLMTAKRYGVEELHVL